MNLLGFPCSYCGWHPLAVRLQVCFVQSSASRCHSSWHVNVPETDPCLQGILMAAPGKNIRNYLFCKFRAGCGHNDLDCS